MRPVQSVPGEAIASAAVRIALCRRERAARWRRVAAIAPPAPRPIKPFQPYGHRRRPAPVVAEAA